MLSNLVLHLDMDGVLCDFDAGFVKISDGVIPSEYREKFGRKAENELFLSHGSAFWSELPWIEGGPELLRFGLDNFKLVRFLTSSGTGKDWTRFKEVAAGKTAWITKHAPSISSKQIIVVPFPNLKARHAGPDRILVDDREPTIKLWNEQGGIGIFHHHSTWKDTVESLKEQIASPSLTEIVRSL